MLPFNNVWALKTHNLDNLQSFMLYNGNNPWKKMFANWHLFLIHEETLANGDNSSWIYSFLVQLPISLLAMPIFPTKVATVEALQSYMRQCSSYSGHTHFQLLNRVILPKHSNTAVEYSAQAYDCSLKTSNLHPSDLHWNTYRSQVGFSAITALCLSQLDLHLWAGINKTKKWKLSKNIFADTLL